MRFALPVVACLLLLPIAAAQAPSFSAELHGVPAGAVPVDAAVRIGVDVTRTCSVAVTHDYQVHIEIHGPEGSTITGPSSLMFPAGPCTGDAHQTADYQIFMAANTTPLVPQLFSVQLQASPVGPGSISGGNNYELDFAVVVAEPYDEPEAVAADESAGRESPAPPAALLALAVLAAAFVLRRRL